MPCLGRRLGAQRPSTVGTCTPVRSGPGHVGSSWPTCIALAVSIPGLRQHMGPAPGAAKTCALLCAAATRHQASCVTSWAATLSHQQFHGHSYPSPHVDKPPPRQATAPASSRPSPTTSPLAGPSSASAAAATPPPTGIPAHRRTRVVTASGLNGSTFAASCTSSSSRSLPSQPPGSSSQRAGSSAFSDAVGSPVCPFSGLSKPHPRGPAVIGMADRSDRRHATAATAAAGDSAGGHEPSPQHTNRLASEQSPYLLQHAHNPVDWYPWGEEAFARARAEDKPIFLSVGYATCHWCHVMERESFEDEAVAELLNRDFVAIKVDREERPDVDRVYMTYVQAVSGSGGWPMSVWLTPSLEPFYGGTYYPPKASSTLAQLTEALQGGQQQPTSTNNAATATAAAAAAAPAGPSDVASAGAGPSGPALVPGSISLPPSLAAAAVDACGNDLARRYDAEFGGFGGAPKFPRPSEINLLLRAASRQTEQGDPLAARRLRSMALHSLSAMAAGGMYDQLGGGFHRYSVDELWHVPHFEKMLYDNPQLAATYLSAFQLTGEKQHAMVARGVLDYLLRDMSSPTGGLYSAEDADSLDPHTYTAAAAAAGGSGGGGGGGHGGGHGGVGGERKEGAFYVWDHAEVMAVLGPELGPFFGLVYGIEPEGNCSRSSRSDPHGEFEGKNVPYIATQPEVAAARLGLPYGGDAAEAARRLAAAREALHAARAARPRPSLDDKIVTAWNGMGIGAFALASRVLASEQQVERLFPCEGRPAADYLEAARRVAGFVRGQLWEPAAGGGAGRLRRSYCKGPSAVPGFADDYSALVSGLLDLYECGGGREWLEWAMQLQAVQDALFWDPQSGGYFSTADPASSDADPSIRIRIKDDYDGAEPTASSLAASNLLRLADLVPERPSYDGAAPSMSYDEAARRTLAAFSSRLTQAPLAVPQMACAAHTYSKRPLRQVIVAGGAGAADTGALLDAVHSPYCPDKVVLVVDPTDPRDMDFWFARNPAAHAMVAAHFAKLIPPPQQQQQGQQGQGIPASATATATAFICQNFTCQAPTTDPARVRQLLTQRQAPPSGAHLQHFDLKL